MNYKIPGAVFAVLVCQLLYAEAQIVHHDTRITVKVVDDGGEPVGNALVKVAFGKERELGKAVQVEGVSEENGLFAAQHSSDGQVFCDVEKPGYYSSTGHNHLFNASKIEGGRWQPWDLVFDVVLRKINNPIPVYRKYVNAPVPEIGKPVGYDLMVGDWIAPHGKGVSADLVFLAEYSQRSIKDYNFKLTVNFPRTGDGIQEITNNSEWVYSDFKWPYSAPDSGYMREWIQIRNRTAEGGEKGNRNPARKYALRIRSTVGEDGKIVSALYGRISGDFMDFTYCINPKENDRNLEYSGENLFEGDGKTFAP